MKIVSHFSIPCKIPQHTPIHVHQLALFRTIEAANLLPCVPNVNEKCALLYRANLDPVHSERTTELAVEASQIQYQMTLVTRM